MNKHETFAVRMESRRFGTIRADRNALSCSRAFASCIATFGAIGMTTPANAVTPKTMEHLQFHVQELAAPEREGRGPGSTGLEDARKYVESAMKEMGLAPGNGAEWRQVFSTAGTPSEEVHVPAGVSWEKIQLANVIGWLPGTGGGAATQAGSGEASGQSGAPQGATGALPDPAGSSARTLIVSAHIDHLGKAADGTIYPGADDNASGVAVLLEVARNLEERGPFENAILFVAFDGEEAGLLGSRHYATNPIRPLDSTVAVINLDTVGRMEDRRLYALGAQSAPELEDALKGVNLGFGFDLAQTSVGIQASDQVPFQERGIPALQFTTGAHPDYHRPGDLPEEVHMEELGEITDFTTEVVAYLADLTEPLTFVPPGAKESIAVPPADAKPRQVSLGTIPDFARESGGVLLTGVMPGSPAEQVGFQKGDILVGIGGMAVDNLADMSAALKSHQPGDEVEVEVQRDGTSIKKTVVLVERKSR